jgi:hypothetical protein
VGVMSVVPAAPPASSPAVSRSMRSNRRRDTAPEKRLRSALHARGWRFRVDLAISTEAGRPRPDMAFTRAEGGGVRRRMFLALLSDPRPAAAVQWWLLGPEARP